MDIVASSPVAIWEAVILKNVVELQFEFKAFFNFLREWTIEIMNVHFNSMTLLYLSIFYAQNMNVLPSLYYVYEETGMKLFQEKLYHIFIFILCRSRLQNQ